MAICHMPYTICHMLILTSPNNPRIKEVVNLRESDYRKKSGLFLIEGRREFELALAARIEIKEVFLCPELLARCAINFEESQSASARGASPPSALTSFAEHPPIVGDGLPHAPLRTVEDLLHSALGISDLPLGLQKKGISTYEVSAEVYNKIAFGNRKDGILAAAREPKLSLADLKLKNNPLLIVLERIEKPGNLGAIVRTADASGADAVIASDSSIDIYNPHAVRSSLGALFTTQVVRGETKKIISWLKSNNIKIICALPQADLAYTAVNFRESCAIVLGSEDKGLGAIWKDSADYRVRIPMLGKSDSLNVATAAGVLLYEAIRQRKSGLGYFGKPNHGPPAS